MKTKRKNIYNQLLSSISVIASIGAVVSLFLTFNLKENSKITETFIAVALGVGASLIAAYLTKIFIHKKNERVFILYSHKDKEFVDKLKNDLRKFRYLAFIDSDILKVGDKISDVIEQIIEKSDIIIFVVSESTLQSKFVKFEFEKAIKTNKKILPLKIQKNIDMPSELTGILYADFTGDYNDSLKGLIKGIEKSGKITSTPNTQYS